MGKSNGHFSIVLNTVGLVLLLTSFSDAQVDGHKTRMLRISEDNDFINVWGHGTDRWYSHGLRLEFFQTTTNQSKFILDRFFARVGGDATDTYGWGFSHVFTTPSDITKNLPDLWDYPYAGQLFFTRTLHSSNPRSKTSIQSELSIGLLGPASMARELQVFVHKKINDELPMGWNSQWENDLIINYTSAIEQQLVEKRWFDLIVGARVAAGSSLIAGSAHALLRFGKRNSYFNGLISQFSLVGSTENEWQLYITLSPCVEYWGRNALVEGGMFRKTKSREISDGGPEFRRTPARYLLNVNYGLVLASKNTGISITQKSLSSFVKGLPRHEVGNITLYFRMP